MTSEARPGPRRWAIAGWLADKVLGVEPVNRRLAKRGLMSVAVYATSLSGEALGVRFGFNDPLQVALLSAYLIVGAMSFYVLIRSGLNRHLRDPTMSAAQILFPISALLIGYPVSGPMRGLNLLAVVLPPLFGFLSMSRRKVLAIVASVPPAFGAMMLFLSLTSPARFDPRIEAVHFAVLTTCMTALGVLLWQISSKRDRLRTQQIELSLALERIEAISTRDELTGLFNRHYMTTRLEDEVARHGRGGAPFCVCLIDVDFFKRINDAHGHARGDAVLRSFARVMLAGLREVDVLARWGGEEFLLLLPGTSPAAGLERIEGLRHYNAALADWRTESALRVRFSAGIAEGGDSSVAAILDRVDRALYRAKANGRDQVVLAAELEAA